MHRLSEYSFNTNTLQNNGVSGMFPQKLLSTSHLCVLSGEQPPAFRSPTVGLTAQDNSSCFDSLLWLHKSIFTAVLESILYSAFPQSQVTDRIQFVLPGQQKENLHGTKLELLTEDEDTS